MMKNTKYLLAVMLVLSACAHDQIKPITDIGQAPPPKMPDLPIGLKEKASPLPDLTDKSLTGAQIDGTNTDRVYNGVALQLNKVIDAWGCVASALNAKTDPIICFENSKK